MFACVQILFKVLNMNDVVMKILLIITDYGSFNNFLSELAVKLVNTNNEVHVICSSDKVINFSDKYSYTNLGIKFHYIDFPRSFNLFKQILISKRINKKINEIDPYLINIHFTTGIFTTVLWRKPKYITIGTFHGVGYPTIKAKLRRTIFKLVEKFCFKRLDQIFLLNQSDYNIVKQIHPHKTFIYNSSGVGYDIKKFDPLIIPEETKEDLSHHLQIKHNDFVLVFTGRFTAIKGFNTVIKTVISLVNELRYNNIKLLIIGGEDPIYTTGLSTEETKFYKNSSFIKNIGFTPDVNLYLSISDLFVFPSEKEGMPVCIMEALAMGVPVITSNSRGCNDLIENNFNGILLSEKPSVDELSAAILKLYHNRFLLKKLSVNAQLRRTDYSRDKYVSDQIGIYQNSLKVVGI